MNPSSSSGRAERPLVALAVVLALAALAGGLAGGLARFGVVGAPAGLVAHHGALMMGGFFGTLIALERAVALRAGRAVPLLAGLGAVALAAGVDPMVAALAWISAGAGLVALYVFAGVRRAWSLHLVVEAAGAACWPLGTLAWWLGDAAAATAAWSAFLLLTIAGERRELAQFVRLPAWAQMLFAAAVAVVLAAVAWRFADPAHDAASRTLWWLGAGTLGVWLLKFDVATKAWRGRKPGWPVHTARCLVVGYLWLLAAALLELLLPAASLHVLLLGFVFAMVFGHAPIMLPALARLQPRYTPWAQAPLVVMAASLAARIGGVWSGDPRWLQAAGVGHVIALVLFAAVMANAAWRGRAARAAAAAR